MPINNSLIKLYCRMNELNRVQNEPKWDAINECTSSEMNKFKPDESANSMFLLNGPSELLQSMIDANYHQLHSLTHNIKLKVSAKKPYLQ